MCIRYTWILSSAHFVPCKPFGFVVGQFYFSSYIVINIMSCINVLLVRKLCLILAWNEFTAVVCSKRVVINT